MLPLAFAVAEEEEEEKEASCISSTTRFSSAGKVRTWPERRSSRACSCMVVGQLEESAFRAWRRRSWILKVLVRETVS